MSSCSMPPIGDHPGDADTRKKRDCPNDDISNPDNQTTTTTTTTQNDAVDCDAAAASSPTTTCSTESKKSRAAVASFHQDDDEVGVAKDKVTAYPSISVQKLMRNKAFSMDRNSVAAVAAVAVAAPRTDDDLLPFKGWDLETALHHVVGTPSKEKEFISHDKDKWITFRVGDGGDASTIASLYHRATTAALESRGDAEDKEEEEENNDDHHDKKSTTDTTSNNGSSGSRKSNKSTEDTDALELRLSSGLGDEDTPPTIFAVMVEVRQAQVQNDEDEDDDDDNDDDEDSTMAMKTTSGKTSVKPSVSQCDTAVALLTLDWKFNQRILRVEWMYVDQTIREHDLIQRRLWFRLSALALVTACQLLPEVEDQNSNQQAQQLQQSTMITT